MSDFLGGNMMVQIGDLLTVQCYLGKPDQQTGETRVVAREPETGKIILFDRAELATRNIVEGSLLEVRLAKEKDTYFIAQIMRVVPPEETTLPDLKHVGGFYSRVSYGTWAGETGYVIPVPWGAVDEKKVGTRTVRVEVFLVN